MADGTPKRSIEHILRFRDDIAPFLVHLTRSTDSGLSAEQALTSIIYTKQLVPQSDKISDARFGYLTTKLTDEEKKTYFSAICFTETPLPEIHCLLNIESRSIDLEPYGLVFIKESLAHKGVSPVLYINNINRDKQEIFIEFCSTLIDHIPDVGKQILPLIAIFGDKIQPPHARVAPPGEVDFRWEREWRYPYCLGPFIFDARDIFVGLCPDDEIEHFEECINESFSLEGDAKIGFVDPTMNMKWYASKLIKARERFPDLKYAVVC
jgi:hypothetical protein